MLSAGQDLEFVATFSGGSAQHGGFGLDFNDNRWAIFSTQNGGALFARTHDGVTPTDTLLPGSWLGSPHRFRIEWASAVVNFYIDGTLVASHAQAIAGQLRPAFSDFSSGGDSLVIDSVRLAPYATSGHVYITNPRRWFSDRVGIRYFRHVGPGGNDACAERAVRRHADSRTARGRRSAVSHSAAPLSPQRRGTFNIGRS